MTTVGALRADKVRQVWPGLNPRPVPRTLPKALPRGLPVTASRQALTGCALMQRALDDLNERLASELAKPLRMGIGVHLGTAIVGSMGPPNAPIISAIGDDVNVAARLEQKSKDFTCTLIVSRQTIEAAGLDFTDIPHEELAVRGRGSTVDAYLVDNPLEMPGAIELLSSINKG